ncbi:MAG: hypothetical protein KC503_41180 [Myxococcales bacterium]|nr:hypothetical protein [Myxococcales bacterium]
MLRAVYASVSVWLALVAMPTAAATARDASALEQASGAQAGVRQRLQAIGAGEREEEVSELEAKELDSCAVATRPRLGSSAPRAWRIDSAHRLTPPAAHLYSPTKSRGPPSLRS